VGAAEAGERDGVFPAAVLASEARFSAAFANSPLALTISTLDDGRLVEVNEGFVRLSGHTREEALGRTPAELGLWLEPALREVGLAKLRAGEPVPEIEARFRTRSGEERIGVIRAALLDIDGRACVLSSVADITERKRAERLLMEQNRLLERIASGGSLDECLAAVCETVARLAPGVRACFELAEEPRGAASGPGAPGESPLRHVTPVRGEGGRPLGSFVLAFPEARAPTDAERRLGELGARLASIAFERDRAAAALRENQERLAVEHAATARLQETSLQLILQDDVDGLYGQILDAAMSIMRADYASLQLLHPERGPGGELELLAQRGFDEEAARFWQWVRPGASSSCAVALRTRERVVVPDVEACESLAGSEDLDTHRRLGIRAVQTTPLFSRSGAILGMISTHWSEPQRPSHAELRLLDVLARQASDLIERSQAAAALRASEERYRSLARVLTSLVWTSDASGAFTSEQAEWAAFTGQDFEAHRGWGWLAAIHPDDRQDVEARWRKALAARDRYEAGGRIWHAPSGGHRHFVARAAPLFDAAGEVREWIGTITDVHEQAQAAADARFLAELAEKSRTADGADALMADVVEALGEHLQLARCFFAQVDELANRWRIARDHHESGPSIAGEFRVAAFEAEGIRASREGNIRVYEDTRLDPRTAPLYEKRYGPLGARAMVVVPLHREGRRIANLVAVSDRPRRFEPREIALLEAVAERTWNAIERLRLAAELREGEARFRHMADHAPVMVWMTAPDARCSYLSRSWYEFTGRTPESSLGSGWLEATHPDDRASAERALLDASVRREAFRLEYRLRRRDGATRWAIEAAVPRFSDEGAFLGFIGSVIDITERKEAEEALREEARRKDEFLAMLAHELRNPLAPIRNAAHVLKRVGADDAHQQWAAEVIERQTLHLTRLVDDLLDVSRITRGKVTLQRETLDVSAILQRAVEAVLPLVEAREQGLSVRLPSEPLRVQGDLTRLVQVVGNLLNNAAKFSEVGGRIQLEAAAEDGDAVIRVRDDGVGLPAELLSRVFDLFTQADRSLDRSQGGLGIGLTLVKNLVERHGGRVEARSEGPGRGSEFVVRLPALRGEAAPAVPAAPGRGRASASPLRVLVVEDHADSAEMMAFLLQLAGHEVRTASEGPVALDLARTFQPQVVLCDIGLPGMSGYDVAARLRADPAHARTRLIALSGYGQEEDRRRSQQAGFDYHLTKPVSPDVLGALLGSLRPEESARGNG